MFYCLSTAFIKSKNYCLILARKGCMQSARLIFRKFDKHDFREYYSLVGNVNVMKWITGHARTLEESTKIFQYVLDVNREKGIAGYYAIFDTAGNLFIGLGKIIRQNNLKAEIGYALLPEFWGKGYGTEISLTLIQHTKMLPGITDIIAIIDPENAASKKILLKCDFELHETCILDNLPAEIYRLKTFNSYL